LAWKAGSVLSISSRNSVPRFDASIRPVRGRRESPSWPNSSISATASGSAAQLTATNGRERRLLQRWRRTATSSLPVPV